MTEKSFDKKTFMKDLKIDAHAVGIPDGSAKIFVEKITETVEKNLQKKEVITEADLKRLTLKEIKKYNHDFAYVYENRDKIV